jgi:hypothetical protein
MPDDKMRGAAPTWMAAGLAVRAWRTTDAMQERTPFYVVIYSFSC